MAYIAFVGSLIVCGTLLALIPVDTLSSRMDSPDYHYVPFAGDAFGA